MNQSLTTFDPKGNLFQVNYAINASNNGQIAIGLKGKDVGIIITIKYNNIFTNSDHFSKIYYVNKNIGITYAGMLSDYIFILNYTRKIINQYQLETGEDMPMIKYIKEISLKFQEFTQRGGVRPMGISLLILGNENDKTMLYEIDASGIC